MIVINARFLTQERQGAQRFAEALSLELKRQRDDLVFVTPRDIRHERTAEALNARPLGINRGALWEQLDLPVWLSRRRRPLLLSLGNTAPAYYRNQFATHHDLAHVHHPQGYPFAQRLGYRLLLPPLLGRARAMLTVSGFSRSQIAEHYSYPEHRIGVVPNAASGRFRPALNEPLDTPPYLLMVCSLRAHKNVERAIQAFLSLKGNEGTELRIVTGEHAPSFPDYFPVAEPRVQLLGRLSDEELLAQYRGARALLMPSLYEGFGMPALEAQASGCPVLAASNPALMETFGDSAMFFDPLDVPAMALCMRRALNEPALRAQLRIQGLENARRYSWKTTALWVSELLDQALAQGAAGSAALTLPLGEH